MPRIIPPNLSAARKPLLLVFALLSVLLFGCTAETEAQDKYAGDAYIPEPEEIVDADFASFAGGQATGELLILEGHVVDTAGTPLSNAIVYIQQTDQNGRYREEAEEANAVDPHFQYQGWIRTDEQGRFTLRTIAPGAYVGSETEVPHIHIQARHGDIRSYYHSLKFHEYPPRNGDTSYLNSTDKWTKIVELSPATNSGADFTGEFELVAW